MSEVKNVTLEEKINKLESEIQQLKVELSIALEYYAETREFLSLLTQLMKTKTELSYSKPVSILESTSSIQTKPKSKLDSMLDHCINLIFKDYREQCERE
jgi:chromosome condensin MukBEF ATPase and DNA-binding subunit MukB